jgi:hypothetical protein
MRFLFALGLLVVLTGCAERNMHVPVTVPAELLNPSFLNMQAGMRLRVVTPILKSGGYVVESLTPLSPGDFSNLRAGADYIGYESDHYAITKHGAGVRIDFLSGEIVKEGKPVRQLSPTLDLFKFPPEIRYVRLVYLVRVSRADHNMAIVGADNLKTLELVTGDVQADLAGACQQMPHSYCSWVPTGIGIQVENPGNIGGRKQ